MVAITTSITFSLEIYSWRDIALSRSRLVKAISLNRNAAAFRQTAMGDPHRCASSRRCRRLHDDIQNDLR
jgi:hypothetical protein